MQLMLVMLRLAETLTLDILGSRVRNLTFFIWDHHFSRFSMPCRMSDFYNYTYTTDRQTE